MWISYHVFLWDINIDDYFLNILDQKFKKIRIKNYFFIRYWFGGPHIRIRVKKDNNVKPKVIFRILKECVDKVFEDDKKIADLKLDKLEYYKNSFTDGLEIDPNKCPWYKNGDVIKINYSPELNRYGGIKLINKSEEAFVYSTRLIMDLLEFKPTFSKKLT